ncbi:TetR/AcrR family transcriptional regulator [Collimonas fungivorans]|uniref:Transcriptional regulator n=1 Tax=Collimonas fungivorans (strain Ter331) TaxID=1005048 RepID=G0AG46_COLFT|nr:TetR/AcrR family transcriptional regulator [Collimonas fungivorans]AEK59937.1 Transcriptional regulator [Collimonas fungivorans Ter331]
MTTAQRLTDRKREAILEAAIAEFRANGFETTSMDKIAARAQVSKRTVYNHFPGKEELFAEILMQLWESSAEQRALIYRHDKPLRPQLLELMQSKMRMLSDSNFLDLARVAIAATIHSPERTQDMVARLGEREEGINTWISAAQADGRLKPGDPAFAAHQLQGLLKTFAFWPQVTLGQPPLAAALQQQVVDSAVDMFLANYAAGGPAR